MRQHFSVMAGCAVLVMSAAAASADCAADLAALQADQTAATGEVAKDGALAPLQEPGAASSGDVEPAAGDAASEMTGAEPGAVSKDGTRAPLEATAGQDAGVATSAQDAQAQQEGDPTAAQAAEGGTEPTTREAALAEAEAALAAGDEAGCNAAVQQARNL